MNLNLPPLFPNSRLALLATLLANLLSTLKSCCIWFPPDSQWKTPPPLPGLSLLGLGRLFCPPNSGLILGLCVTEPDLELSLEGSLLFLLDALELLFLLFGSQLNLFDSGSLLLVLRTALLVTMLSTTLPPLSGCARPIPALTLSLGGDPWPRPLTR